jgi:SulP family sulfate permease
MKKTLIPDIMAGLTVSFAALSLGAAFGVMSGRGAFAGMIGAAIIPIITSLFGGTRIQASGPTAPMTAVTAVIVAYAHDHFSGDPMLIEQFVTLVLLAASLLIVLAGVLRLGRFIKLVPQVVVLGFMNGIAILIWKDQIAKLFGFAGKKMLEGSLVANAIIAFSVLVMIYTLPLIFRALRLPLQVRRLMPSIFLTILIFTAFTQAAGLGIEHVKLGDGVSSFGAYLSLLASYIPSDARLYSSDVLMQVAPLAFQLCMLAYLDSLLTSLIIDKMVKEETRHDKELLAQGLANGVTALLQGIPGAQATIRSVLLVKEGAKSRSAGVFVGVFALLGLLVFSKLIGMITAAVFVGVLFKAGLDVLDRDFPRAYFRYGWFKNKQRNFQLAVILYTTIITVFFDLNIAVITGTVIFYIAQKFFGAKDAESDFSDVENDELLGQDLEVGGLQPSLQPVGVVGKK